MSTVGQHPGFIVDPGPEGELVEAAALAYLCGDQDTPGVGWSYAHGPSIGPSGTGERTNYTHVVLSERLVAAVRRLNPDLPEPVVQVVIKAATTKQSPVVIEDHREHHRMLIEGVPVVWDDPDGTQRVATARLIDWENPESNDFLAVNQYRVIVDRKDRRPDIILLVNGMPLGQIECKAPGPAMPDADPDAEHTGVSPQAHAAVNQIAHYTATIPDLYRFVEIVAVTDLRHANIGTISTPAEHFAEWKTMSEDPEERAKRQLQLMIEGAFRPAAFLDLIRNFVVFESDGRTSWKVMAKYHQVHAVNAAIDSCASAIGKDRRGGLVWHTQGAGKSYTMAFFVSKLRRDPRFQNPTVVCVTDRTDLDNQLAETFDRLPSLKHEIQQAQEISGGPDSLHELVRSKPAGGIIFTTIQKFQPPTGQTEMPVLSDRKNIIVLADEAHRSQYANFAQNLTVALPNATRLGFTGTPVEMTDRSTRTVFGDYVSVYRMRQAQEDRATVPIYYESRQIEVDVADPGQLRNVAEVLEGEEEVAAAKLVRSWAQLEKVVGAPQRIARLVDEVATHFTARQDALEGKGMVVCYSRRIAAQVTRSLQEKLGAEAVTCIISAAATDDPQISVYRRTKAEMAQVAKQFRDPDDPLKVVVVKDMWLTGFDVPSLHTLYVDKPMRDHGLLQAIARVNRVFRDKPGGLVVDFIGIGDDLRESLRAYDERDLDEPVVSMAAAVSKLREKAEVIAGILHEPEFKLGEQRSPSYTAILQLDCQDFLLRDEELMRDFLDHQAALAKWYALCRTEPAAIAMRPDVAFFAGLAAAIREWTPPDGEASPHAKQAVKQFFSEGIAAGAVIDVFGLADEDRPEISVLSDQFLDEIGAKSDRPNLRIGVLEKLLRDEIKARKRTNNIQAVEFETEITELLGRYRHRQIESAQVIKRLIEIAKMIRAARHRHQQMGLSLEEAAFYDALAGSAQDLDADPALKEIAQALVQSIKQDLSVDWTNRKSTEAKIRTKIKHLLRVHKYTPPAPKTGGGGEQLTLDYATDLVLRQARALYRFYPAEIDALDAFIQG